MVKVASQRPYNKRISIIGITSGTSTANAILEKALLSSIVEFSSSPSASLTKNSFLSQEDKNTVVKKAVLSTLREVTKLLNHSPGWNGYDALPPEPETILYALEWISQLFLDITNLHRQWMKPNVTANDEGEIVFEWWYGEKKLTVYIGDQHAEYVKVWGTDINRDMSDGNADKINTCRALWEWLTSKS